ncbi:MAG: biopolymer transporter ExbD [Thermoguttaceae bacterium]|jgi:biopolymer transport protein ExbD
MFRRRSQEEVELNLASMLDMAFQLLFFFILTFKPPPAEGQIGLRMPPAQPCCPTKGTNPPGETSGDPTTVQPLTTLAIQVVSRDGGIDAIQVGVPGRMAPVPAINQLNDELIRYFKGSADAFEQVVISASPELAWSELMRVVESCANQRFSDGTKLGKLSFVALPSSQMP